MAQPNLAARNLSLMEELEKLEQSITLTLQGTRRSHDIGIGTWMHALADPFHTQKSITTLARRTESLRRASSPSSTSTGSTRALCGKHQRYRLLFFVPLFSYSRKHVQKALLTIHLPAPVLETILRGLGQCLPIRLRRARQRR